MQSVGKPDKIPEIDVDSKNFFWIILFMTVFVLTACGYSNNSFFYFLREHNSVSDSNNNSDLLENREKALFKIRKDKDNRTFFYTLKKPYNEEENKNYLEAKFTVPKGEYVFAFQTTAFETDKSNIKKIPFSVSKEDIEVSLYFKPSLGSFIDQFSISNFTAESEPPLLSVKEIYKEFFSEGWTEEKNILSQSENIGKKEINGKKYLFIDSAGFKTPVKSLELSVDTEKNSNENKIRIYFFQAEKPVAVIEATPVKGKVKLMTADIALALEKAAISSLQEKWVSMDLFDPWENTYSIGIEIPQIEKNIFKTVSINRGTEYEEPLFYAIEADFSTILNYHTKKWRDKRFELFAWSQFPDFLVIDTINYAFQAAMFKRLAFFVEKPNTVGTLLTNEELEGRHGWNAHDYKADDLCNFFNLVTETNFPLNPEEELLQEILITNNIIKISDNKVIPDKGGGILSISRESSTHLRYIFAAHEGYHGVFFINEKLRNDCSDIWESLPDDIKKFWEFFFQYRMKYDITNHYLLVNEFMAYNLQQPIEKADSYYFNYIIPLLSKQYPAMQDFFSKLTAEYRADFTTIAQRVADVLYIHSGLPAGNVVFLDLPQPDK